MDILVLSIIKSINQKILKLKEALQVLNILSSSKTYHSFITHLSSITITMIITISSIIMTTMMIMLKMLIVKMIWWFLNMFPYRLKHFSSFSHFKTIKSNILRQNNISTLYKVINIFVYEIKWKSWNVLKHKI